MFPAHYFIRPNCCSGRLPGSQGVYLFRSLFGLTPKLPTLYSLEISSSICRRVHTLYLGLVGGLLVGRVGRNQNELYHVL